MRQFEGIMSKADEEIYNLTESFTYEELVDYWEQHPELLKETKKPNIPVLDMTYEEFLEKYNLVDMTDLFKSHGLKIDDI